MTHTISHPPKWAYAIWYLFLAAWMQGMAPLNILWPLLVLVSIPWLPHALQRLTPHRWLWGGWVGYEALRIISAILAEHPAEAAIGLFDDLRYTTIALAVAVFVRTRHDLVRAGWASFIGFTILAWTSLAYQLIQHGDLIMHDNHVRYGVFGHVNYAAAWSAVVMLTALIAIARMPFRRGWAMLLLLVPMTVLQVPLGSRATMLAGLIAIGAFILISLFSRNTKGWIAGAAIIGALLFMLAKVPGGIAQFRHADLYASMAAGEVTPPSMAIRLEIFRLIARIIEDHPLGLGPRGNGFVDLNPYREWIAVHMPATLRHGYGITPERAKTFDFSHPHGPQSVPVTYDPHSQYAASLAESGWPGLVSLFALWAILALRALHLIRNGKSVCKQIGAVAIALLWIYAVSGITVVLIHQAGGILFFSILTLAFLCPDLREERS